MESRIKYAYLRDVGKNSGNCIVQNGQVHPGTGEASHVPVMVVPGNGVGTATCGPGVLPQYLVPLKKQHFEFTLYPVK